MSPTPRDGPLLPVVAALDALEAGDVRLATAILLGAIEGDSPRVLRFQCECGQRFEWPGQLEEHRRWSCAPGWTRKFSDLPPRERLA